MNATPLPRLADELLAQAHASSSGRAAHNLLSGRERVLRQSVFALTAGTELSEHESPGEATLQLLRGRARLITASGSWEASAGALVEIPAERHSLTALDDTVGLLTVAKP